MKFLNCSDLIKLVRLPLSMAIAVSGAAGYLLYSRNFELRVFPLFIGILLLSSAASALNQIQERHTDALMKRTMDRPLPGGRMEVKEARLIFLVLSVSGCVILLLMTNPATACLGLFNMLVYNAIYTPLKRRTALALLPGALTGAVPPMMGWLAAGGVWSSPLILSLALFLFLWQIPHFLLLLLKYGRDYADAGFPGVQTIAQGKNMRAILFVWLVWTGLSSLLFPLFGIISNPVLTVVLILANIFLLLFFFKKLFGRDQAPFRSAYLRPFYIYQALVLILVISGNTFRLY